MTKAKQTKAAKPLTEQELDNVAGAGIATEKYVSVRPPVIYNPLAPKGIIIVGG